jgi:hypothetical protein
MIQSHSVSWVTVAAPDDDQAAHKAHNSGIVLKNIMTDG